MAETPAEALAVHRSLGVTPRVAFSEPNDKILTVSRNDRENNIYYTYAYSYKAAVNKGEEPFTFTLELKGEGVPYELDDWTGKVTKIGRYEIRDGRTCVDVTLQPGESTIIVLDLNGAAEETVLNTGEEVRTTVKVPEPITLDRFDITIEDWNAGEKRVNTEEKFGHTTTEVYYETKKTKLVFKNSTLIPWKDLPASDEQLESLGYQGARMQDVSGVGRYEAAFNIPEDWKDDIGAYLQLENAGGASVAVSVNGRKAKGVNTRTLKVDISDLFHPGENTICIEVATSLYNRLVQRGYYSFLGEDLELAPFDYGLMGSVSVIPYSVTEIS